MTQRGKGKDDVQSEVQKALAVVEPGPVALPGDVSGAESDEALVGMFLARYAARSKHSAEAYRIDVTRFRREVPKPLARVTAADLLAYRESGVHRRGLAAVKSLFRFAVRLGYLRFDPASVIELPQQKDTLAERIVSPDQVLSVFAQDPGDVERQLLVRFLYGSGCRIAEAVGVCARDLIDRADGMGQVTLYGKRRKTRAVLLPAGLWKRVRAAVPATSPPDAKLIRWSKRRCQEIVKEMATAAGIPKMSPHWFRHAHTSHAARKGVGSHVLMATLGWSDPSTMGRYLHAMPDESSALSLDDEDG